MWALGGEVVRVRGIIARHCSCEARIRHTRYETVLSFVMYVLSGFTGNYESSSLSTTCDVKSMQNACVRVLKLFDGEAFAVLV